MREGRKIYSAVPTGKQNGNESANIFQLDFIVCFDFQHASVFTVPIIPEYLIAADRISKECLLNENETTWLAELNHTGIDESLTRKAVHDNVNESYEESLMEIALKRPVRAISENSKVGWLLSSKALVQLLVNPVIGLLSNR